MADVNHYIDKLEVLREYLFYVIDERGYHIWMDVNCVPFFSPREIIQLFYETGVLFSQGTPPLKKMTVDEFYSLHLSQAL